MKLFNRLRYGVAAMAVLLSTALSAADEYAQQWGPGVGAMVDDLVFVGADGEDVRLSAIEGERGTLLFLNRSADW